MNAGEPGKSVSAVPYLSPEGRALYEELSNGRKQCPPGTPGLDELVQGGFIANNYWGEDYYVPLSRARIYRDHVQKATREFRSTLTQLESIGRFMDELPESAGPDDGGVRFLADADECHEAAINAMHGCRSTIWTAQPVERNPDFLEETLKHDIEKLNRGIKYRTIYLDIARQRPHQKIWAEAVMALGAEVRTLPSFHRMVLIDADTPEGRALISDHRPGPGYLSRFTGWLITNPGLVAKLVDNFEEYWDRANPWIVNSLLPDDEDLPKEEEEILRGLLARRTNESIAMGLGVDKKTITNRLGKVYARWGLDPGDKFGLGMAYQRYLDERRIRRQKEEDAGG